MNRIIISILFLCGTILANATFADVTEADSAYMKGNYSEAIELYRKVVEEHGSSAALLFNLGSAFYQDGDLGQAMLCYERARKLDPSNPQIKANLNYLRNKVEDANKAEQKGKRLKTGEDEPTFFQSVNTAISSDTKSNTWAGWGAACFLLFSGFAALYIFSRNVMLRKAGFFGGMILLGISMICIVFSYMAASEYFSKEYGVLIGYKCQLLDEPVSKADNSKGEILTRGTKVRIISEEVDAEGNVTWYKVRLNSDYIGWVPSEDLAII